MSLNTTTTKPHPKNAAYQRALRDLEAFTAAQRLVVQAEMSAMVASAR